MRAIDKGEMFKKIENGLNNLDIKEEPEEEREKIRKMVIKRLLDEKKVIESPTCQMRPKDRNISSRLSCTSRDVPSSQRYVVMGKDKKPKLLARMESKITDYVKP